MAEKEPRKSAPVGRREGWFDAGTIWCIGVHMACMTSGGRLSKRIMVSTLCVATRRRMCWTTSRTTWRMGKRRERALGRGGTVFMGSMAAQTESAPPFQPSGADLCRISRSSRSGPFLSLACFGHSTPYRASPSSLTQLHLPHQAAYLPYLEGCDGRCLRAVWVSFHSLISQHFMCD